MGEITKARVAAAGVLRAVSRGQRLDLALQAHVEPLSRQDRRFVQEVAYGTLRLRGRLDYLLSLHLRKGLSSLSTEVLNLLRLGAYQLVQMDGVPSYAAISQTVDQVRKAAGQGRSRMANGVLRSLDREGGGEARFPSFESDPEAHLASWGSHPAWMIRRWMARWSPEDVRELVAANNRWPPLFVRPLGVPLDRAMAVLEENGWRSREGPAGIPCLRVDPGIDPARILEKIGGMVQDPGAILVTEYADLPIDEMVGDLCAAPGGKALALAHEGAYVLAADRSLRRLGLLRQNLARVGGRVDLVAALAEAPPFRALPNVLLDVPCSGTGTLRRHPDARWRLTEATLNTLIKVQGEMLEVGSRLIPRGGLLVYSTCSLEWEENQGRLESFLSNHREFSLEPSDRVPGAYLDQDGMLSVLPQATGFDGAFAARMVRRS